MNGFQVGQAVGAQVVRGNGDGRMSMPPGLGSHFKPRGRFKIEHIRDGKVLSTQEVPNGVTNEGLNHALSILFNNGTQVNPWYIGLVDNASFTAFAAGDVMNSHAGWIEMVAYDEATRNDWAEDAESGQSITNSTAITFNINATKTLKGVFVTSISTKSGTTGVLWATAAFAANISVVNLDDLKITYTVSVA